MPNLLASLIDHWFWVFLDGRLKVRVTDQQGRAIVLDAESIEDVARNLKGSGTQQAHLIQQKLQFGRDVQAMDLTGPDFFQLAVCPPAGPPKWDSAECRFESEDRLAEARAAYRAGRLVGFDVPVHVSRTDNSVNEASSFEIYLRRSEDPHPPAEVFLREGLCISGQKYLRESGVHAIIKVEDDELGNMLGDAENPAHTKWERNGKHFKGRYVYGPSILSYVQRSAVHLCTLLSRQAEGLDKDLLKNLFFVPEPGDLHTRVQKQGDKGGPPPPPPEIEERDVYLQCTRVEGGFRIVPHPRATKPPAMIQIRAAYEVIRGNAYKYHHPADFDFTNEKSISLVGRGVEADSAEPNRLLLRVTDPAFHLTVSGFDPRRDLMVDVKPIHDSEPSDEDEGDGAPEMQEEGSP